MLKTVLKQINVKIHNKNGFKIRYTKKGLFGREKVCFKEENNVVFLYWIEFRLDEGRFYYGEYKLYEIEYGIFEWRFNYIHTKNGTDRSIKILDDIIDRIRKYQKRNTDDNQITFSMNQIADLNFFRQFDRKEKPFFED